VGLAVCQCERWGGGKRSWMPRRTERGVLVGEEGRELCVSAFLVKSAAGCSFLVRVSLTGFQCRAWGHPCAACMSRASPSMVPESMPPLLFTRYPPPHPAVLSPLS